MTRPWWAWTKGQRPQDLSASLAACRTVLCVAWNMWHISIMIQMHNYKIIPAYDFLPLTIDFFSSITDLSYVLCLSYIIHLVYPHIGYINRYVKHDKNYILNLNGRSAKVNINFTALSHQFLESVVVFQVLGTYMFLFLMCSYIPSHIYRISLAIANHIPCKSVVYHFLVVCLM